VPILFFRFFTQRRVFETICEEILTKKSASMRLDFFKMRCCVAQARTDARPQQRYD
jgi:hypothetical protein